MYSHLIELWDHLHILGAVDYVDNFDHQRHFTTSFHLYSKVDITQTKLIEDMSRVMLALCTLAFGALMLIKLNDEIHYLM